MEWAFKEIWMNIIKNYIALPLFSLIILLSGCEDNSDSITEVSNPESVSVAFFNALYNEKDVKKAASVCSPKLARILLHYKSTNAVARHVFNMSYDSVEIKPDDSGVKVREQFKDSAIITIYFNGLYNEGRHRDVKRVSLIQVDGKWIIDELLKDPF